MEGNKEKRSDIIHAITSPLGFFALSLLIVEGFLTIALVGSNLDSRSKFIGMLIGASLFLLVVIGVWLLVWFKPESLTFGEDSHLKRRLMEKKLGSSDIAGEQPSVEVITNPVSPTIPN